MHKRFSAAAIVACSCLLVFSHGAPARTGAAIKVKLNYTGSATVDESHKISVALWDSPGFTQGNAMPIAVQTTTSKTGTVTFDNVTVNPAYASCALDPAGKWDGQSGPPPTGSSLGMYSKTPGTPGPIDTAGGKAATVSITFDDSVKMH